VVQDPAEALFPSMPRHAVDNVNVDHVVPLWRMPGLFAELMLKLRR
jgi:chemotaxis response regulator CheB